MNLLLLIALMLVAVAVFAVLFFRLTQSGQPTGGAPATIRAGIYQRKRLFFSDAEKQFFERLRQAIGDEFEIFAKVRLIDLLDVKAAGGERQSAQNCVIQKHADFVLVAKGNYDVVAAIELDDRSHHRPDRYERDRTVDAILQAAGLPLLRVSGQRDWDPASLRAQVQALLSQAGATSGTPGRR